jgi:RNA polymerase sigma factor (sigma-70 family)
VSDDDLIQAARDGHEYAAAFLVSLYGPRILGYCRSLASDLSDVDCEHIVELAIEKAVRKIDHYDQTRGRFEAWLRTFVLHATQDWRRGHHRLVSLDAETATGESRAHRLVAPPLLAVDSDDSARLAPLIEALRDALPTMNPADQVIIALRDLEGRPVDSVAATLHINPDACRQRHYRARMRLKKLLDADPRTLDVLPGELV